VTPREATTFVARFPILLRGIGDLWLPLAVVLALVVVFSFGSDAFLSLRNMTGILGQASTLLLACLGASFVILMGSIDLSVGAIVLLVGAISVKALNQFDAGVGTLLIGMLAGGLLGLANGLIYALGRIPSFVVTLGTLSVFTGAAWE
jgi:ribose transport system permease protein